ncbi:MAG TPA: LLM class flavin-dependent oxidoreductase, partial [Propionibacteriaceae bacterium]|nr:LLM class flavin-dependent oxidoreductase [Propionibacteriaceae bacterium]
MPMLDGHRHQMPGPVEVGGPRCRRQASAHRWTASATASAEVRRPTWHDSTARHRVSTPTVPVCAQPSGCRSSTVLPTRRWSRVWPPRRRRPAGTESLCGTTCAGGRRSGRWPARGSRWAAIATATEHLRLGPMITPLAHRRPAKVAKETATLDRLSDGRLTLGVGLGSDRFAHELSATGEELDDRQRGQMLDESLEILTAAWSGEPVHHHGQHYTVDGISFLPRPVQRPGVPVWAAGFPGNVKPLRRAARHDGFFPVNLE